MDHNIIIQAKDVHRSLPLGSRDLHILRGISFSSLSGDWMALTGPSGSGKSTLLGILGGIDRPSSGQVFLDEVDIGRLPERQLGRVRNEKIGFVFQSFNLIPSMTALENVELPLHIHKNRKNARKIASDILALVGLSDRMKHLPRQLSGGEQQRVAIARALVTNPLLLLADEPTGNLDSSTSLRILELLAILREEMGLTVVMVTHDTKVASHADYTRHIVDGKFEQNEITISQEKRIAIEVPV